MAAHEHLSDFIKKTGYYDLHSQTYQRVNSLYGAKDIKTLFGNLGEDPNFHAINEHIKRRTGSIPPEREQYRYITHPKTTVPWDRAQKGSFDKELVERTIAKPRNEDIEEFDPRLLSANQPHILSAGVRHYMTNEPGLFADKENAGNQLPFVYVKKDTGQGIILAGHHRAAAALLRGGTLRARTVKGE